MWLSHTQLPEIQIPEKVIWESGNCIWENRVWEIFICEKPVVPHEQQDSWVSYTSKDSAVESFSSWDIRWTLIITLGVYWL